MPHKVPLLWNASLNQNKAQVNNEMNERMDNGWNEKHEPYIVHRSNIQTVYDQDETLEKDEHQRLKLLTQSSTATCAGKTTKYKFHQETWHLWY